jgi:DNA-binding response OmpR family regulator
MRVMLVEDQKSVARFIKKSLEAESYCVDAAGDKDTALQLGSQNIYDLILLDLDMQESRGLELLAEVRQRYAGIPVVAMTSRNGIEESAKVLEAGADECLAKPFSVADLIARMRDLLRRRGRSLDSHRRIHDLAIDRVQCTVHRAGRQIDLTPKEFALLGYLACNAGQCVTPDMIIEHVWNFSFGTSTSMVNMQINHLRRKVDGGFDQKLIRTVRGVGYLLASEEESRARKVVSC